LTYGISESSPISISISNEKYQKDILSSISIQYCQFFSQLFLVVFYEILKGFHRIQGNSLQYYTWGELKIELNLNLDVCESLETGKFIPKNSTLARPLKLFLISN
jgi:hypothetical protein